MVNIVNVVYVVKVDRTITIDKEINDIFKQDPTINASALINELLKKWKEDNKNE